MARRYWCEFCDCLHDPGVMPCPNPEKQPDRLTETVNVTFCANALHELDVLTGGKWGERSKLIQRAVRREIDRIKSKSRAVGAAA